MAFGFGFNKQKVLSAAEKFVQQGKLQNAITEYEKIIKADSKDLTVMNTVGDLYSRLGESERAIECFKNVGDAYAQQGFTVKAIAMYKKLSKLRPTLEGSLRLAELYTQQGLFNDARAQYLQVAEEFLRGGELEQAVRIFQKTLEMDPDNVNMRTRLAEVYLRLGKKAEAWDIFATAAESLRGRGAHAAADEILQRMLTLDPTNSHALLLRGRLAFDSGDIATAITNLERIADLDNHAEGLGVLLQAYLQSGRLNEAGSIAHKLANVHNDGNGIIAYADALITVGRHQEALHVFEQNSDRLLSGDSTKILETLHYLIGHVRENTTSLEMLLDLLHKAGEQTHIAEIYELLAHAYTQSNEFDKARDYYLKLTQLEPHNQLHADHYQQVLGKLGNPSTSTPLITPEEGAVIVDELEATSAFIEQRYPDEVALAIRAAITDAELFASYNMAEKAMEPLMAALARAPKDLRLNQRLAALHTRASRLAEAAVCCRNLESVYHDAGYAEEASRYGELANRYEERTGSVRPKLGELIQHDPVNGVAELVADLPVKSAAVAAAFVPELEVALAEPEPVVEASSIAPVAPTPVAPPPTPKPGLVWHAPISAPPAPPVAQAEFAVQATEPEASKEIDLSDEWEVEVVEDPIPVAGEEEVVAAIPEPVAVDNRKAIAETVEEIRFYLANGLADQANAVFAKLEKLNPDLVTLMAMRDEIAAANAAPAAAELEVVDQLVVDEEPVVKVAPPPPVVGATPKPAPVAPKIEVTPKVEAPKPVAPISPVVRTPKPQPVAPAARPTASAAPVVAPVASSGVLGELVSDLESSLGDDFLTDEAPAAPARPPELPKAKPAVTQARVQVAPPAPPELGELVADLETSLGPEPFATPSVAKVGVPAPKPAHREISIAASAAASPVSVTPPVTVPKASLATVAQAAPAPAPAAPLDPAAVDLTGMFSDLRHELEEGAAAAEEDPETHYNLGVAFREMGLLDEAIGELQKVCQSVDRGHAFPQLMQTYTWLAQCFLDKGVPEAAIRWYQQALKLPNLDGETMTALYYELGSSYEAAQNKPAALQSFLQVYGSNIDYRDVAERIKALRS
jgi:tetratricopeptide (TPR) repeat protein